MEDNSPFFSVKKGVKKSVEREGHAVEKGHEEGRSVGNMETADGAVVHKANERQDQKWCRQRPPERT